MEKVTMNGISLTKTINGTQMTISADYESELREKIIRQRFPDLALELLKRYPRLYSEKERNELIKVVLDHGSFMELYELYTLYPFKAGKIDQLFLNSFLTEVNGSNWDSMSDRLLWFYVEMPERINEVLSSIISTNLRKKTEILAKFLGEEGVDNAMIEDYLYANCETESLLEYYLTCDDFDQKRFADYLAKMGDASDIVKAIGSCITDVQLIRMLAKQPDVNKTHVYMKVLNSNMEPEDKKMVRQFIPWVNRVSARLILWN